ARSVTARIASSWSSPAITSSAPRSRIACSLLSGTSRDTAITASMPSSRATYATARPWFPVEAASTPRRRCSSDSRRILFDAPRILNAPVGWWVSNFNQTSFPTFSDRASLNTTGVRIARSAMRPAAARTWARVTSLRGSTSASYVSSAQLALNHRHARRWTLGGQPHHRVHVEMLLHSVGPQIEPRLAGCREANVTGNEAPAQLRRSPRQPAATELVDFEAAVPHRAPHPAVAGTARHLVDGIAEPYPAVVDLVPGHRDTERGPTRGPNHLVGPEPRAYDQPLQPGQPST